MKGFERFVNWFNNRLLRIVSGVFVGIAGVALLSVVLVIISYITLRRLTEFRIYFVEEWSAYAVVLIVYFSITYALMTDAHVAVDVVVRRLPRMMRQISQLLTGLLGMIVVGYLTERSWAFFWIQWESKATSVSLMHTPMWIPTLFVPLGLCLFGLGMLGYNLQKTVELVNDIKAKRNHC